MDASPYLMNLWPHLDRRVALNYYERVQSLWRQADELRRDLSPDVLWMTPDDVARSEDIGKRDAERVLQAAELDETAEQVLKEAERADNTAAHGN